MRFLAASVGLLVCSFPLPGFAVDQNSAFQITDKNNRHASDDSLQHSTVYAMNALMDLSNLNVKSAVNNGMTAYGKYRNSETLDQLGDLNYQNANRLSSVGASTGPTTRKTDTTFRRLDPSFLRSGKFGQVAEEFEKRSGMPRENFLSQMSEISEKKISRHDPKLMDKVLGRFENFLGQVPNPEFKAGLQKGVNMVPQSVRTGLISQAITKFSSLMAGASGPASDASISSAVAAATSTPAAPAPPASAPATGAFSGEVAAAPATPAAPAVAATLDSNGRSLASSDIDPPETSEDKKLGNLVTAAIDTQTEDLTIFQQMTRKYRMLTVNLGLSPR